MKKLLLSSVVVLSSVFGFSVNAQQSVSVSGSTSVTGIMEVLAEKYQEQHGSTVDVQGTGSSAGIRAANDGTSMLGMSSREVKDEELQTDVRQLVMAMDGIAVTVNKANGVNDLSPEQVKLIYTGEINNWKQVGGADMPIVAVTREVGSGTRSAFEDIMDLNRKVNGHTVTAISPRAQVQSGNGAIKTMVANNAAAIGYISLGSVDESLTAISIDGHPASREAIRNGEYAVARPFVLMLKQESPVATQNFLDYILSDVGAEIINEQGYISVN